MPLIVLCPTRGRPAAAWETLHALKETKALDSTRIVFVVDLDDPSRGDYAEPRGEERLLLLSPEHQGGMGAALNAAAMDLAYNSEATVLGFVGDDHRFRTPGWDALFRRRLLEIGGGLAYGNDLFWHKGELPTQIFISVEIVRALGWMALPGARHLYFDNAWLALGEALDRLLYFPNYAIEHMHPSVGKSPWDDSYLANNSPERYASDRAAFEQWRNGPQFELDVERARSALSAPVR